MRIELSAKIVTIPQQCVCCRRAPDTRVPLTARGKTWGIPYCNACLRHVALAKAIDAPLVYLLAIGVVCGGGLVLAIPALDVHEAVLVTLGGVVLLGCSALGFVLRSGRRNAAGAACSGECASMGFAAMYLGWRGTIESFYFANRGYAAEFMKANESKLINLSPSARQLWHAVAEEAQRADAETRRLTAEALEVRLAANAAAMVKSRAETADLLLRAQDQWLPVWVAKIGVAKGPAGRRAALSAALAAISRPDLRNRLMVEAGRIEVDAALEKADALKTPAAKLRTLEAALEAIRADDVPDELQAQQIRWLEDAIGAVSPTGAK